MPLTLFIPPAVIMLRLGNIKNTDLFAFLDKQFDLIQSLYVADSKRLLLVQKDLIKVF
jgi:predicted nuclease of predicted toxin-antitoxin system